MSQPCIHEDDWKVFTKEIHDLMKDVYNDGKGIKYKVNVLWENYYKDMGKRDILLTVNTVVVLIVGGLTILDKLGVI